MEMDDNTSCADNCEMTSIDDGIVIDHDDDSEIEDGQIATQQWSTPMAEFDSCTDVHVGAQLHYHGTVTINQNFVTPAEQSGIGVDESDHHAVTAPVQLFDGIKQKDVSNNFTDVTQNGDQPSKVSQTVWCFKKSHIFVLILGIFLANVVVTLTILKFTEVESGSDNNWCSAFTRNVKVNSTRNYSEVAKCLQEHCNNVNDCFNMFYAVKSGDLKIVKFLLDAADMKALDTKKWTPLHHATNSGKIDIVEIMYRYGANISKEIGSKDRDLPIHLSAYRGYSKLTEWFLNKGISVMVRNKVGSTALHSAAWGGYVDVCRILLDRGADVNAGMTYKHLWTPLHKAAIHQRLEVGRLLVDRGAEIDAITSDTKQTSLHYAAKNGDYAMVQFLITKGANTTIKDYEGKTAQDLAMASNHTSVAEVLGRAMNI